MTLQPEEERLRERFEAMRSIVESPNQFRVNVLFSKTKLIIHDFVLPQGQIRDLLSNVRFMNLTNIPPQEAYQMDPNVQEDIKQFLMMQQQGIAQLVKIVNDDLNDLKIIQDGLNEVIQLKR